MRTALKHRDTVFDAIASIRDTLAHDIQKPFPPHIAEHYQNHLAKTSEQDKIFLNSNIRKNMPSDADEKTGGNVLVLNKMIQDDGSVQDLATAQPEHVTALETTAATTTELTAEAPLQPDVTAMPTPAETPADFSIGAPEPDAPAADAPAVEADVTAEMAQPAPEAVVTESTPTAEPETAATATVPDETATAAASPSVEETPDTLQQQEAAAPVVEAPLIQETPLEAETAKMETATFAATGTDDAMAAISQPAHTSDAGHKSGVDWANVPQAVDPTITDDPMMSQQTLAEAASALNVLATAVARTQAMKDHSVNPKNAGQYTLDNLMKELLKPLLKEWLDANLPSLVKWLVTEQIEKMLLEQKHLTE